MPSAASAGRASTGSGPPSSSLRQPPKTTVASQPAASRALDQLAAERQRAAVVGADDDRAGVLVGGHLGHLRGGHRAGEHDHLAARARAATRASASRTTSWTSSEASTIRRPSSGGVLRRARSATRATTPCFQVSSARTSRGAATLHALLELGRARCGAARAAAAPASPMSTPVPARSARTRVAEGAGVRGDLGGAPLDRRPVQQRGAARAPRARARARSAAPRGSPRRSGMRSASVSGTGLIAWPVGPVQLGGDVDHHRAAEHGEVVLAAARRSRRCCRRPSSRASRAPRRSSSARPTIAR